MLPHHYARLTEVKERNPRISYLDASTLFIKGIVISETLNRQPERYLYNGEVINYREDLIGDTPESIELFIEGSLQYLHSFIDGDPEQTVELSLEADGICQSCAIGAHCLLREQSDRDSRGTDSTMLANFYTWYLLLSQINQISKKEYFNLPRHLKEVYQLFYYLESLTQDEGLAFNYETDRGVTSISIKRKHLFSQYSSVALFLKNPYSQLLRICGQSLDEILPVFEESSYDTVQALLEEIDQRNIRTHRFSKIYLKTAQTPQ